LSVEWLNPQSGAITSDTPVGGGSTSQSFTPPFSGDAVLYLVDATASDGGTDAGGPGRDAGSGASDGGSSSSDAGGSSNDAGGSRDGGRSGADGGNVAQDGGTPGGVTTGCACGQGSGGASATILLVLAAALSLSIRRPAGVAPPITRRAGLHPRGCFLSQASRKSRNAVTLRGTSLREG
jgi:hypothetical protein